MAMIHRLLQRALLSSVGIRFHTTIQLSLVLKTNRFELTSNELALGDTPPSLPLL